MIKFGKGIGPKSASPKDRLLTVLNLDLNNEEEITKFCEANNLFILPINSSYSIEVKKMLFPLKEIVDYYLTNKNLLPEHVQKINEHLKSVAFELTKIDPKEIKAINLLLSPSPDSYDYQSDSLKTPQYAFVSCYADSFIAFWQDFAKLVVRNQKIQTCANCGKYFTIKAKSHGQRYCSTTCQERYKKKRQYNKHK